MQPAAVLLQVPEDFIPSAKMTVQPADAKSSFKNWKDYSLEYKSAFKVALLIQGVLAVLTLLVLDYGQMHRAFWVSFLCQWAMVIIILLRRPMNPTRLDLAIVRYGVVPIFILIVNAGPWLIKNA